MAKPKQPTMPELPQAPDTAEYHHWLKYLKPGDTATVVLVDKVAGNVYRHSDTVGGPVFFDFGMPVILNSDNDHYYNRETGYHQNDRRIAMFIEPEVVQ